MIVGMLFISYIVVVISYVNVGWGMLYGWTKLIKIPVIWVKKTNQLLFFELFMHFFRFFVWIVKGIA